MSPSDVHRTVDSVRQCRTVRGVLPLGPTACRADLTRGTDSDRGPGARATRARERRAVRRSERRPACASGWAVARDVFYDPTASRDPADGLLLSRARASRATCRRDRSAPTRGDELLHRAERRETDRSSSANTRRTGTWRTRKKSLTDTVGLARTTDRAIPLPHPSPRNNIWLKKNPWFTESLLPALKTAAREALAA